MAIPHHSCVRAIKRFFVACPTREARFTDLTAAVVLFGQTVPSADDLTIALESLVRIGVLYTRISAGSPCWGLTNDLLFEVQDLSDAALDMMARKDKK